MLRISSIYTHTCSYRDMVLNMKQQKWPCRFTLVKAVMSDDHLVDFFFTPFNTS